MEGLKIGRLFGIDIELHWSVLILGGLIGWILFRFFPTALQALSIEINLLLVIFTVIMFFISILLHELAHSLVGKKFGIEITRITLLVFGGAAQFKGESMPDKPKAEFLMALAGPVCSLILSAVFYALFFLAYYSSPILAPALAYLGVINLVFAIFNLYPLFPLDGGRILRSILWWRNGSLLKATGTVVKLKELIGGILVGVIYFFFGAVNMVWVLFILLLLIWPAANNEYQDIFIREKAKNMQVKDILDMDLAGLTFSCSSDDSLPEALKKMKEMGVPTFIVEQDGNTIGAISFRKIMEYLAKKDEGKNEPEQTN